MLRRLNLVSGEPLLHPEVHMFAEVAREYFPNSMIAITTNGILLNQMTDTFWSSIADNDIGIEITKYPIELPLEQIENNARKYGVSLRWYGGVSDDYEKSMMHMPLDLSGHGSIVSNWSSCYHANRCITLKSGRLYTCSIAPCIGHFNEAFGTCIDVTVDDSICIYDDVDAETILSFLAKTISFCKYCDTKNRRITEGWKSSSRRIEEWM